MKHAPEADVEELTELISIRADLDAMIQGAIRSMRADGYTRAEIVDAIRTRATATNRRISHLRV